MLPGVEERRPGALWRRRGKVRLINVLVHAPVCEELDLNINRFG